MENGDWKLVSLVINFIYKIKPLSQNVLCTFTLYEQIRTHKMNCIENSIKLASAIFGVTLVMLPVTWLYLKSRVIKRLDQSLVQTMLLLPIAVAGVVSIVQHSIALAFSLAGIVAGVRFRNTLKNTGDSLFIFITNFTLDFLLPYSVGYSETTLRHN